MSQTLPQLHVVLREFEAEVPILSHGYQAFDSESSHLWAWELIFTVRSLVLRAQRTLERLLVTGGGPTPASPPPNEEDFALADDCTAAGPGNAETCHERLQHMVGFLKRVEESMQERLRATEEAGKPLPRVVRLGRLYKLTTAEQEGLVLLMAVQAARSRSFTNQMAFLAQQAGGQVVRCLLRDLCRLSALELERFLDEERDHIRERLVLLDGAPMMMMGMLKQPRLSSDALCALLGQKLTTEQRLKLSNTAILSIISHSPPTTPTPATNKTSPVPVPAPGPATATVVAPVVVPAAPPTAAATAPPPPVAPSSPRIGPGYFPVTLGPGYFPSYQAPPSPPPHPQHPPHQQQQQQPSSADPALATDFAFPFTGNNTNTATTNTGANPAGTPFPFPPVPPVFFYPPHFHHHHHHHQQHQQHQHHQHHLHHHHALHHLPPHVSPQVMMPAASPPLEPCGVGGATPPAPSSPPVMPVMPALPPNLFTLLHRNGGLADPSGEDPKKADVSSDKEDELLLLGNDDPQDDEDPQQRSAEEGFKPYATSLEYLDERFQLLGYQVQLAQARLREDIKRTDAGHDSQNDSYPGLLPTKKVNMPELEAKRRITAHRIAKRLRKTRVTPGAELPRLEALAEKLGLDGFEKDILVMLIGHSVSPVLQAIFTEETPYVRHMSVHMQPLLVKKVLETFSAGNFPEQVSRRKYFYKSARLVRWSLVKLVPPAHSGNDDLLEQELRLDRRILDWVVGLETEIQEVVEGSNLYKPTVDIQQVVLPAEQKAQVLQAVTNFDRFREYASTKLREVFPYGAGLVLLFCGPSGTGKTMLVNAIAAHLNKRVLLVNFPVFAARGGGGGGRLMGLGGGDRESFQGLFREAEMHDAILFFDECESIFTQRMEGGSAHMSMLLTELERYRGMTFLATNRPFDLDEAMHRRINAVFEIRPPSYLQRREIWRQLTSHPNMPLAKAREEDPKEEDKKEEEEGIDWDGLALRYELTGGFIKNALVAALLAALGRDEANPRITQADLTAGCAAQMRGALQMRSFSHRVVPRAGLDGLVVSKEIGKQLQGLVGLEKARSVLFGEWGFGDEPSGSSSSSNGANPSAEGQGQGQGRGQHQQATTALFWGPSGTGKSAAAEAIGFEVGRPLKVVSWTQLAERAVGGGGLWFSGGGGLVDDEGRDRGVRAVFDDARLMDAIVVIEDVPPEVFALAGRPPAGMGVGMGGGGGVVGMVRDLFWHTARFPGTVILTVACPQPLTAARHALGLDPLLLQRFRFVVEFASLQSHALRAQLWRRLLPAKVPLAADVDLSALGRFELTGGQISSAVFRAAAAAALRPVKQSSAAGARRQVTMADLEAAAEEEVSRAADANGSTSDVMAKMFT